MLSSCLEGYGWKCEPPEMSPLEGFGWKCSPLEVRCARMNTILTH